MAAQFHFLLGVATDWKIGKQLATAAHSTDAELRSLFTAVKSTLALRAFMMHLGYGPPKPTHHHEDNQPSIDIVSANQVMSRNSSETATGVNLSRAWARNNTGETWETFCIALRSSPGDTGMDSSLAVVSRSALAQWKRPFMPLAIRARSWGPKTLV
eukprot:scaffold69720_cov41-Attheya_sp.AAC.2